MTTSSMFLADTTNIDYAMIDSEGYLVGGSYRPKFIVTGTVDPHENVVVDFSTIKKTIKRLIDDVGMGFDHKLWIHDGRSLATFTHKDEMITIVTPRISITAPANIVRFLTEDTAEQAISNHLQKCLAVQFPAVDIQITTELTTVFDSMPGITTDLVPFRMTHGLKNSTSFGCNNIAHGHLSYIAASSSCDDNTELNALLNTIADSITDRTFIWDENLTVVEDGVQIAYTCYRGPMRMYICSSDIIIMSNETTIENIVAMVAEQWGDQLRAAGATTLYISEGLSKGACQVL